MSTHDDLSAYCKAICGMDATEVARLADIPRRTFHQWWHSRHAAVKLMIHGVAACKHDTEIGANVTGTQSDREVKAQLDEQNSPGRKSELHHAILEWKHINNLSDTKAAKMLIEAASKLL